MLSVLAQAATGVTEFVSPRLDYHAFGPEFVLVGVLVVLLLVDMIYEERAAAAMSSIAGIGLLGAMIPILTLANDGSDRIMFGGSFVVDDFSLVLKATLLLAGYIIVLLSTNYVAEGDYYEPEYYFLLISSLSGMVIMASARDLITIFVALELLSIPAYLLASWRKSDDKSNEAGVKYYLMGVFASAVMLYGMSLVYGATGSTRLQDISASLSGLNNPAVIILGITFTLIGFGFKVSAVPFHTWAPDTYEGAPTPITAFLAVASKSAGFIALLTLIYVGFFQNSDIWQPLMWMLAALTMTVGNVIALKQTNVVRLLAYSGVAQAGFMLVPLAVAADGPDSAEASLTAIVTYLIIYTAMNLGAFAVVIAVARKTRSAEISSFGGLFQYAPGMTVLMSIFLFSLAGIPPLGGWVAKFMIVRALFADVTTWGIVLGVVVAVNAVISLAYYANIAKHMWFMPVPDEDRAPIVVPFSLSFALMSTAFLTILFGVYPDSVTRFGEIANFVIA